MRIRFHKPSTYFKNKYMCECLDLTGPPPIGKGKTKNDAFCHLCTNLLFNGYAKKLDLSKIEVIK